MSNLRTQTRLVSLRHDGGVEHEGHSAHMSYVDPPSLDNFCRSLLFGSLKNTLEGEANRSICGQINSAGCMILDDGKCGHYDYRLHVRL